MLLGVPLPRREGESGAARGQVRPESADEGHCKWCQASIWWVRSVVKDVPMPLDREPDPERGTVEIVLVGKHWRAEVLAQTESLFDDQVDYVRPRWVPHFVTCPQATKWHRPPKRRKKAASSS